MLLLLALSVNCTYANVDSNDTVANLTNTTAIQVLADNNTLNGTNTSNNTSTTTNNSVSNGDTDNVLKTNANEGNTTNANTKNTTSTNTGNITNTVTNQVNSENSVNLITVTAVDPVNKAVNVAVDEVIKVTFSDVIKAGTSWFELRSSDGKVVSVTSSISGNVLTITPANALIKGTKYALILHTGSVTDLAGNNLAYYGTNFVTTTDGVAPTVKSVDPVNKAVNVAVNKVITVTFSEAIKVGTGWFELKSSNGTIVSVTSSISGNVLTITPVNALIKGTKYALILHTGSVTDLAGNNLAYYGTNFVTDSVALNVKSLDPVNKAVNVAVDKVITVTFSEAIKVGTGWFELKSSNGTIVSVTSSISGNVLTITPANALIKGTKYALILHTGSVTDLAGNNLAYYGTNFVTVSTTTSTIPAALLPYLQVTKNCQSTNVQIISLSKSIIANAGATTTYAKAEAIFNWVRNNIGYSFYYNTKYGAVGTLNAKTGNCVDTTHLLIALERAAGIPARYVHGYCKFSTAWYGHVWAQVYVNGKWYTADAISYRNTFGVINNWNTATAKIYGTYATLSF